MIVSGHNNSCWGSNVSGHKRVWAQTCLGTNVSGHNHVWVQTCLGTVMYGLNRVGTIMSRHKRVWSQSCLGTIVPGPKRVWAQTCLGTNVSGHKHVWGQTCVGPVLWAQSRMGTNVVEPPANSTTVVSDSGIWQRNCATLSDAIRKKIFVFFRKKHVFSHKKLGLQKNTQKVFFCFCFFQNTKLKEITS